MKKNGSKTKDFFTRLRQISARPFATENKSEKPLEDNGRFRIKAKDQLTSGKSIISGRLVTKGFVLVFSFTMVILGGLACYTWRSNRHLKRLETTHFRLLQLSGQIIHIDEVLTMSTHMAVETGEPQWEERYRKYEPQLDSAIEEVLELSPEQFMKEAISRTDTANIKLVALENRAFDLIRQGDRQTASNLLHNTEYTNQKQVYSDGINEISNAICSLEEARLKKERRIALTVIVLLIVTMPLVGFIWFAALRILKRYIVERKQSELALRMSEQCFHAIADYSYFWEIWVNPAGRPIWTNPAVHKVTGYTIKELMAMRDYPMPLVYEEDKARVSRAFGYAVKGGKGRELEFRLCKKDGTVIWVDVSWQPIYDEKGLSIGHRASVHDIMDRKQAEEAMIESQARYRILFESASDAIILMKDDIFVDCNQKTLEMFGCNRDEIVGQSPVKFSPLIQPDGRKSVEKAIEKITMALDGTPQRFEWKHKKLNGSLFDAEVSLNLVELSTGRNLQAIVRDISERKQAEEALLESEQRFRDFFENAPIGFHIFGPDQIIIDINDAELEMIGYSRKEIVGKKTWEELIVPQQRDISKKHWHNMTTKGHVRNLEYTLVHKDGHHINVILNASARFDKDGNVVNTRGSVLNITARKEAEQARQRLNKELEVKNKELESILYAASHDLKSPLVNIQGFSHELSQSCELVRSTLAGKDKTADKEKEMEVALSEDIPQALDYILASSAKMDALLSGLLDISRLDAIKISVKPIDVNAMMANVIENIKYRITKTGAELDIKSLPACLGDISQINRVFTNLLTNALKFLDKSRPGKIHIYGKSQKDNSIYCVEDNGIGIAPEHQEKIFEIFYQLEPEERKGDGLGLTIARRIIDRHNGKIWIESEVGKGTKFFVALPNV